MSRGKFINAGDGDGYVRGLAPAELSLCDNSRSFLQSAFWGRFKARFGWEARAFLVEYSSGAALPLLVLIRPLGPGLSFAYVPWGPELPPGFPPDIPPEGSDDAGIPGTAGNAALLAEIARRLRPLLPRNIAFIRFDPPWYAEDAPPPGPGKPFSRAAADVQPPDTVILDLGRTEEEIRAGMKEKWRYNIRLAAKRGVVVRRSGPEELDVFYRLFQETARRDGIAIHSREYYAALFGLAPGPAEIPETGGSSEPPPRPEIRLYIASHEGEDLAAIITLFRGAEGVYLYGASSGAKRNLMAPYLLQWTALTDAKAAGCLGWDLFGIPPDDNPDHPMAGLYRFKTGFGGRVIHRPGSWDYPCRHLPAALFHAAEALRKTLRSARKRRRN